MGTTPHVCLGASPQASTSKPATFGKPPMTKSGAGGSLKSAKCCQRNPGADSRPSATSAPAWPSSRSQRRTAALFDSVARVVVVARLAAAKAAEELAPAPPLAPTNANALPDQLTPQTFTYLRRERPRPIRKCGNLSAGNYALIFKLLEPPNKPTSDLAILIRVQSAHITGSPCPPKTHFGRYQPCGV